MRAANLDARYDAATNVLTGNLRGRQMPVYDRLSDVIKRDEGGKAMKSEYGKRGFAVAVMILNKRPPTQSNPLGTPFKFLVMDREGEINDVNIWRPTYRATFGPNDDFVTSKMKAVHDAVVELRTYIICNAEVKWTNSA
jgi:hypothetical protein